MGSSRESSPDWLRSFKVFGSFFFLSVGLIQGIHLHSWCSLNYFIVFLPCLPVVVNLYCFDAYGTNIWL